MHLVRSFDAPPGLPSLPGLPPSYGSFALAGLQSWEQSGVMQELFMRALEKAGEEVAKVDIWLGNKAQVPLIVTDEMLLTLPRKERAGMKVTVEYQTPVPAPVKAGDKLGTLTLTFP